jgi:exodeoxyribonuclease VII small subunit
MAKGTETVVTVQEILGKEFPDKALKGLPFEQGMKLLTELVGQVESGDLPLEQSIHAYERGALLLQQLRAQLEAAEVRLTVVKKGTE